MIKYCYKIGTQKPHIIYYTIDISHRDNIYMLIQNCANVVYNLHIAHQEILNKVHYYFIV